MDEYRPLMLAYERWLLVKGNLESAVTVAGIIVPPAIDQRGLACTPRADYEWRDIPKRKARPNKPAWSGATREYNRQKQAERRAKIRQAVLDVQAERDGRAT
jgi:hypothetical protein